jgi:hypothetical protein
MIEVKRETRDGNFPGRSLSGAALLSLAMLFLLTGCFREERVAGGDDFPNSMETMGKRTAGETSDSTEWNGYKDAPSTPPGMYDSTDAPDAPPESSASSMSKGALVLSGRVLPAHDIFGAVRVVTFLTDTGGVFRAIRLQTLLGIEARDTTWYKLDGVLLAPRLRRVSGAVTYSGGVTERFSFTDADGDGILSARAGSTNRARAYFRSEYGSGRVEERTVVISAGADLLFRNRADNALQSLDLVEREGADTLSRLSIRASAGDTVVYSPARPSNRVDVEHVLNQDGVRLSRFYSATVFADSTRNYPRRYRSTLQTSAGITTVVLLGRDSLPDFAAGDTGRVQVTFASSVATDTLAASQAVYRVALSDTAGRYRGHKLLRIERAKTFRLGAVSALRYRLSPSAPVSDGSFARTGEVDVRLDARAGGWIEFTGASSATGFSGTWADSDGKSGTVHYNTAGEIVTSPAP